MDFNIGLQVAAFAATAAWNAVRLETTAFPKIDGLLSKNRSRQKNHQKKRTFGHHFHVIRLK